MTQKNLQKRDAAEVERKARQNDTMQRQIRKLAHQAFDAEKETETLKKRKMNIEELIENRRQVHEQLVHELQEQEDCLLQDEDPLFGLEDEEREIAKACMEV